MNEDLLNNSFDNEYKDLAQRFADLLRQIVETVDKYGLKRRHFRRHKENHACPNWDLRIKAKKRPSIW
jgi:hypothetical protein